MTRHIQYYAGFPDTRQTRAAITELVELIRTHYPKAAFEVAASPEDAAVVHLYATVDLMDTDELVDLTITREMELQELRCPHPRHSAAHL